jgi:hypothetical protein
VAVTLLAAALLAGAAGSAVAGRTGRVACPHLGRPAIAADARPRALRVFAVQFGLEPARMLKPASFRHAIDCVMRVEVAPLLARGRPNLVVFDEDQGIETLAIGPRAAEARRLLRDGVPSCRQHPFAECATLATLGALDAGYGRALSFLEPRFPALRGELGRSFVAATDTFVRVFMGTMAAEARRYGVYVVASNSQAPFRLTRDPAAVAALRDPGAPSTGFVYAPTGGRAYDYAFLWGPNMVNHGRPAPIANLVAANRKLPLTSFEQALGLAPGPAHGSAAKANLQPVRIPGTGARIGFATSLPAFVYGSRRTGHECDDVSVTYMRCLDRLGANLLIQADANDGEWTGPDGSDARERWQPLSWMGSAWRAVSDPSVRFAYSVNPMMVGNLSDTPFDGQSAILERGRRGGGCHYVGNNAFIPADDDPALRRYAGSKPQFLALAPWSVPDGGRVHLRDVGAALAHGAGPYRYVQTALVADLPFPVDRNRRGCVVAGR